MIKFLGLEKFMLVAYILPPSVVLQEKAPFEAKAAKRKLDYEKLMTAYNKKQVGLNPFFFLLVWICFIPFSFRLLTGLEYIWIRKVLKMKMKRSLRSQNPRCMTTMMMKNLKR